MRLTNVPVDSAEGKARLTIVRWLTEKATTAGAITTMGDQMEASTLRELADELDKTVIGARGGAF